jgi:hypothetical protein
MMANAAGNVSANLPPSQSEEVFQEIIQGERFKLERIISFGQATAVGQWYDQEQHEWVVLQIQLDVEVQCRRLNQQTNSCKFFGLVLQSRHCGSDVLGRVTG